MLLAEVLVDVLQVAEGQDRGVVRVTESQVADALFQDVTAGVGVVKMCGGGY